MKRKIYTYEKDFFEDCYKKHVGSFTRKDFWRLYAWFKGIITSLNRYVPIINGAGKNAIEFGCSLGSLSKVLTDYGYRVTGTDVSSYAVKRAQRLSPNLTFLRHDIQRPYNNGVKFDLVISLDVVEHLSNPQKAIRNMFDIVHPNGVVICGTPNDYAYARNTPSHISVKKPKEWERLFYKAGFKDIQLIQLTFLPFLYRVHWRLNIGLPIAVDSKYICSPVFIIARKNSPFQAYD